MHGAWSSHKSSCAYMGTTYGIALLCRDMRRLWKLAGQRFTASASQVAAAIGPDYSVWQDLPADYTQIVYHTGKAALPIHALGISRFEKAFFLPPSVLAPEAPGESEVAYGRVVHKNALRNKMYPGPLYLRCTPGTAVIPGRQ